MELIIFASLYQSKEVLYLYVYFLLKNFLFTWRSRSGVAFPSYEQSFGGVKFRGLADALRSHSAPRGRILRIVVAFASPPLLVEDSPLFSIACTKGPFKDHMRFPSAGWSISDGP